MTRARESLRKAADIGPDPRAIAAAKAEGGEAAALASLAEQSPPAAATQTPPKPSQASQKPPETPPKPVTVAPKPGEAPAPGETPSPGEVPLGKDGKPLGPWQLKTHYEKLARTYETRAVEAERKLAEIGDVTAVHEKAQKLQARLQEVEAKLQHVDYSQSEEYRTQFVEPYNEAWRAATADLAELTVMQEDGNSRPANASDLLQLSNLPLGEARKLATELFGDSADDVMAHRRRVIELANKQQKALETAKSTGAERAKVTQEAHARAQTETRAHWEKFTQEDEAKYDFLREKEGDTEWNERLAKARGIVQEAFTKDARDPRLTTEQRAEIVRKHANLRGRAIGFSLQKLIITRLQAELAERDKIIAGYKGGEPAGDSGHGQATPGETPVGGGNAMDRARSAIRRAATISGVSVP